MALRAYTPVARVYVNGLPRVATQGGVTIGLRSGFAAATIQFAPGETPAVPGDRVRIELGYLETGTRTVFTGEVSDDSLQYWPNQAAITCEGLLARANRGLGVEQSSATADPTTGIKPAYQATAIADDAIVAALLALYGVPAGDIQADSPAQSFGNIEPVALGKDEPGWNLITEVDRVTFMRTYDGLDGFARRVAITGLPASASVTLTEGVSILEGGRTRTRKGIVNHVAMTGLPDAGGPGVTPFAERFADSPYIPTPPRYQSEGASSPLLETEGQCDTWAGRRLAQTNRLAEAVTVRPERARADIYPGMTLAIAADHLDYDAGYYFFVEQVAHSWDGKGIKTTLGLIASSGSSGVNPNLAPVAIIHLTIVRETLGDGSTVYEVFADGRDSYDPDGVAVDLDPQHGITTYLWGGSTAPATPVGLPTATYVYTSDPTGQTIALTVTDAHLKTGSATVTITAALVANLAVRVLWAAVTSDLLFSPDGGRTWKLVGVAAVGCCEVAHPDYQLAWEAGGALHRITATTGGAFAASTVAGIASITAASINIGPDGKGTRRAWAGGAAGQVWFSPDDGLTWSQVGTITPPPSSATTAITAIEESPYAFGQLRATCGSGQFVSFDAGVSWVLARAYADPALTAARQASGAFSDLTELKNYHWILFGGTSSNTQSRVLEADDLDDTDYPIADKPIVGTGLTIGIVAPALYVAGYQGSTGHIYGIADFTGDGELVALAYDNSFGLPRHIIRDGFFDAIVYGAADSNLFKTYDKFATIKNLKTLAGGQSGKMIGYGPLHAPIVPSGFSVWIGYTGGEAVFFTLDGDGFHRRGTIGSALGGNPVARFKLMRVSASIYLAAYKAGIGEGLFTSAGGTSTAHENVYRTTDGGDTWALVTGQGLSTALDIDASGLACVAFVAPTHVDHTSNNGSILRSDDGGATWTFVATQQWTSGEGSLGHATNVAVDPIDTDIIWVNDLEGMRYTPDNGASFVPDNASAATGPGGSGNNDNAGDIIATPAGGGALKFRSMVVATNVYRWAVGGGSVQTTGGFPARGGSNSAFNRYPGAAGGELSIVTGTTATISTDDGFSFADLGVPNWGGGWGTRGVTRDPVTGDRFVLGTLRDRGTGFPLPDDRYKGLVQVYRAATGTWEDLTSQMLAQLGVMVAPAIGSVNY